MRDAAGGLRLLHDRDELGQREDQLCAGVVELMLDLSLAVERVQRGDDGARHERAVQRDGVLHRVRRVDAHHVALRDATVL
jgi:hypothetical protein